MMAFSLAVVRAEEEEQEIMFGGPQEGEEAPAFTLKELNGREISLSEFKKKKPVLLITGSISCPVFRKQAPSLKRLYNRYGKRVAFYILYTVEAHPVGSASPYAEGEWVTEENRRSGVLVGQPDNYEDRQVLAGRCGQLVGSGLPILLDEMDNAAWKAYGSAPNAAYLIDSKGKIHLRQAWLQPAQLEEALLEILQEEPARW